MFSVFVKHYFLLFLRGGTECAEVKSWILFSSWRLIRCVFCQNNKKGTPPKKSTARFVSGFWDIYFNINHIEELIVYYIIVNELGDMRSKFNKSPPEQICEK